MKYLKIFLFSLFLFFAFPLFADYQEFQLLASRTETATGGTTLGVEHRGGGDLRCYLDVTAASGTTPTLNVSVVGLVNAKQHILLPAFTTDVATVSTHNILINQAPNLLVVDWTIGGGTPSFTFNIQCAGA
jgi:hypothetical protein